MVGVLMGKGNGMDFYYKRKRNVHRWVGFWDFGREEVLRTWGFFQWPQDADAYRKVFRALMRHETKRQSDRQAASTQTDPQIQLHSQIRIHRYRCSECSVRLCEEIQRCLLAFITYAWSGVDAAGGDGDDEEDGDRDETWPTPRQKLLLFSSSSYTIPYTYILFCWFPRFHLYDFLYYYSGSGLLRSFLAWVCRNEAVKLYMYACHGIPFPNQSPSIPICHHIPHMPDFIVSNCSEQ